MNSAKPCKEHPDAPHGYLKDESYIAGYYVCQCRFWSPEEDYHSDKGYEVASLEEGDEFAQKRNIKYTVTLEEDPETGEQMLPLTDEIVEQLGWKIGDTINWKNNHDGSFTLKVKKEEKVWVMIDTVLSYRLRYCVEAPVNYPEYAMDDVVLEVAKEFSQKVIGEQIISHRVVTKEEALAMCDEENTYAKSWNDKMKVKAFFTKEGEVADHAKV